MIPKVTIYDGEIRCMHAGNALEKVYSVNEAREFADKLLEMADNVKLPLQIQPAYSGEKSGDFWKQVNALRDRKCEVYSLGVALQNLEEFVLKILRHAQIEEGER